MRVSPYKNDWVELRGLSGKQIRWLREEVPQLERFYADGAWYCHERHVNDLQQLGSTFTAAPTPSVSDDYAVLHLRPSAPVAIVEAAFRALAKLHHPDVGGDPVEFKRLNAAYQRIKDSQND